MSREEMFFKPDRQPDLSACAQGGWVHSTTLGGKAKSFWWRIDDVLNLHIKRYFKMAKSTKEEVKAISREELEQLNKYMAIDKWVPLSNNVEKLRTGTEKDGIGRFLYINLKWNTTDCQLASQLGAIFTLSGVWHFNGKEKGIKFRRLSENWEEEIR